MAVTITFAGIVSGAVYRPLELIVPHPDPEHPVPLTVQVTAVSVVPVTVAVNCCVRPSTTCAEAGAMVTPTFCTISTAALADLLVSAEEVAVMVAKGGTGIDEGAVYKPVVEIEPHVVPAQSYPLILHVTAVLLVPVTVDVNCCFAPASTEAELGDTLTLTVLDEMVTVVEPLTDGFWSDAAVTVTVSGLGAEAGAV